MEERFAWILSGTTEGKGKGCVKKGLSTHYGTAKVRYIARELTTGVGLVRIAGIGIGTVGIAGIGGSACVGSSGVGSSGVGSSGVGSASVGLVLATLVWYRSEPRNTFGGFSPLVESRKVGCVGSAGDMGKTTVLSLFAASALGNELVAHLLVVTYCRAGMNGRLVRHIEESERWVTGTRRTGEISPRIVGSVVAVVVAGVVAVVIAAVGGTVVVRTGRAVLAAFARLGLLVRFLVFGRLAKLGPGAGFRVVRRQGYSG